MDQSERSPYCKCLYFSANALARTITHLAEEVFAPTGLSPSHAFVLMAVAAQPGVTPGEVAHKMQLKASTVTRLLDGLELRAFVRRDVQGRSIAVQTTKEGNRVADEAKVAWRQLYQRYAALLGESAARQLTDLAYAAHETLAGIRPNKRKRNTKGEKHHG